MGKGNAADAPPSQVKGLMKLLMFLVVICVFGEGGKCYYNGCEYETANFSRSQVFRPGTAAGNSFIRHSIESTTNSTALVPRSNSQQRAKAAQDAGMVNAEIFSVGLDYDAEHYIKTIQRSTHSGSPSFFSEQLHDLVNLKPPYFKHCTNTDRRGLILFCTAALKWTINSACWACLLWNSKTVSSDASRIVSTIPAVKIAPVRHKRVARHILLRSGRKFMRKIRKQCEIEELIKRPFQAKNNQHQVLLSQRGSLMAITLRSLVYVLSFLENLVFDSEGTFDRDVYYRSEGRKKRFKIYNHYQFLWAKLTVSWQLGVQFDDLVVVNGGMMCHNFSHANQDSFMLIGNTLLFKPQETKLIQSYNNTTPKVILMLLRKIIGTSVKMVVEHLPLWAWKIYNGSMILKTCMGRNCEPLFSRPLSRREKRDQLIRKIVLEFLRQVRASLADNPGVGNSKDGSVIAADGCMDSGEGCNGAGSCHTGNRDTVPGAGHGVGSAGMDGLSGGGGGGEGGSGGDGDGEGGSKGHQTTNTVTASDSAISLDILWVKYLSSIRSQSGPMKLFVETGVLGSITCTNLLVQTINQSILGHANTALLRTLQTFLEEEAVTTSNLKFSVVKQESSSGSLQIIPGNVLWNRDLNSKASPVCISYSCEPVPSRQVQNPDSGSIAGRHTESDQRDSSSGLPVDTTRNASCGGFSEGLSKFDHVMVKFWGLSSQSSVMKLFVYSGVLQGANKITDLTKIIAQSVRQPQNNVLCQNLVRTIHLSETSDFDVIPSGLVQEGSGSDNWIFSQHQASTVINVRVLNSGGESQKDDDSESEICNSESEHGSVSSEYPEMSEDEDSSAVEQQPDHSEHPIFPWFSTVCREALDRPSFFSHKKERCQSLFEALKIQVPPQTQRDVYRNSILQFGLAHENPSRQPVCYQSQTSGMDVDEEDTTTDWMGCEFPENIFVGDLGLNETNRDKLIAGRSLGQCLLLEYIQSLEKSPCVLRSSTEGSRVKVIIDEKSEEKATLSLKIYCSTNKTRENYCKHLVRYQYTEIPVGGRYSQENVHFPIFVRSTKRLKLQYSPMHSCQKSKAKAEYSKGYCSGRSYTWTAINIEKALICLEMGVKIPRIVASFGHDKHDRFFPRITKQLRSILRKHLSKQKAMEFLNLRNYFKAEVESGRTAYVNIEAWPDSSDPKSVRRLFWQRAHQFCELKYGTVHAVSIDFVYQVFNSKSDTHPNATFGHLTTLGPEGKLIVIAQFVVEGERSEAIMWIQENYKRSLQYFGINGSQVVFHDNHKAHEVWLRRNKSRFTMPVIESREIILDEDGSSFKTFFFSHAAEKEILAQDPRHVPWRGQLDKLPLSADNRRRLNARIFQFSLKTKLVSFEELDREWTELTMYAMSLAGLQGQEFIVYTLPAELRLGHGSAQSTVQEHSFESDISPSVHALASAACESVTSFSELNKEMRELTLSLCRTEKPLGSNDVQEMIGRMRSVSNQLKQTQKPKARKAESLFALISRRMEKIYRLAPYWCQRLCCMAFTMGRKSSSWSEAINAKIRSDVVPDKVILRHQFGLFGFVQNFDSWVDTLGDKAFIAYRDNRTKELARHASPLSRDLRALPAEHESELDRFVTSYAVLNILQRSRIAHHNFTFSRCAALNKESMASEIRSRVAALCSSIGIDETSDEIQYFQPRHRQILQCTCCSEKYSDKHLDDASYDINRCSDAVVAVYFPSSNNGCKIECFSDMFTKGQLSEIVLYCSCQEQTSRGIPCVHQMNYILNSGSMNMRNVVWLCHPTYIRGYSKQ